MCGSGVNLMCSATRRFDAEQVGIFKVLIVESCWMVEMGQRERKGGRTIASSLTRINISLP